MSEQKTGLLIRQLRTEHGMTQKQLAERLCVSDKAVSKWERGIGLPDVPLLASLASIFEISIERLLSGNVEKNIKDGGNMRRIQFYACPQCGNVMTATGKAEISCCGRKLDALKPVPCDDAHAIDVQPMDGEMYISFAHGMSKEHHIRFVACTVYDRVLLVRLYPEQGSELRMPYMPRCTYYIGCSKDGLFTCRK